MKKLLPESLNTLWREFSENPFAQENDLSTFTPAELETLFEEHTQARRPAFELSPEEQQKRIIFEKCRELYCLILQGLESEAIDPWSLESFRQLFQKPATELVPPEPPEQPQAIQPPPLELPLSAEPTATNIELSQFQLEELHAEPAMRPKPAAPKIPVPEIELEVPSDDNAIVAEPMRESGVPSELEGHGEHLKNTLGKQYFRIASELLADPTKPLQIPSKISPRVRALFFCDALELELEELFRPAAENFWSQREIIRTCLEMEKAQWGLNPYLKNALAKIAQSNVHWLYQGKLPLFTLLHSLCYLKDTKDLEGLSLSLPDIAILVLLFGHKNSSLFFPIRNRIGLEGLSEQEAIEFSLRLIRIDSIRKKFISPNNKVGPEDYQIVEEDVQRVLTLSAKTEMLSRSHDAEQIL